MSKTTNELRADALAAFDAAVAAVRPQNLIPRVVRSTPDGVVIDDHALPLVAGRRQLVAVGKAAPGLAAAWLAAVPAWEGGVFVLTPHGVPVPEGLDAVAEIRRGAHPYPDADGEASSRRMLEIANGLEGDDLLVVLVSGGGSALMAAPESGLSLDDVRATTESLLTAGAPITAVNTVRRQLLACAGGGLARAGHPARVVTLIVSDVLGDPLPAIASGPTVPSPTTAADALHVLDRFGIREVVPEPVSAFLQAASASPHDTGWTATTTTRVIGNNRTAVVAAAESLSDRGYLTLVHPGIMEGDAGQRGHQLGALSAAIRSGTSAAFLVGGETTVTVRGKGRGGRNQELALNASFELERAGRGVLLAGGTDGIDGLSDNAGAVVDPGTIGRVRSAGFDPEDVLARNDSGTALESVGDAITTGPTGTNVCDVIIVLSPGAS
jgi:glycerate-2-kinase